VAPQQNWAGNHVYEASQIVHPQSVEEVRQVVATAERVKALGTRHSFTDVADTPGVLVCLDDLPPGVAVDRDSRTVSVSAGTTYGALASELEREGWALANLASLPHISVAGAVATGTHGSGDRNQSLAALVTALEIVGPEGDLRTLRRGDPDFDGSVVALGALGVVTRLELEVEPTYAVRQVVYTGIGWESLDERFDELTSHGYSVSLMTRFDDLGVRQLWVKSRADQTPRVELAGATPADRPLHMLDDAPTEALTEQGGVAGAWLDRLPHFKMDFTPSRGEELQSEYLVPRDAAVAALHAMRRLAGGFAHLLQSAEIRTVAADDLWLSAAFERDVVGLHLTWVRDMPAVLEALGPIEDALLPLGGRPHWGKVFRAGAGELALLYPRFDDFRALRQRADPASKFGNAFLDRVLGQVD
jgi:xylitol oxidase